MTSKIFFFVGVLLFAAGIISIAFSDIVFLAIVNVLITFSLFLRFSKNPYVSIVLFFNFYIHYSALIGRYIAPEIAEKLNAIIDYRFDLQALSSNFLFLIVIYYSLPFFCKHPPDRYFFQGNNNPNLIIVITLILIGVFLQVYFIDLENFYLEGRAHYSPLYEYSIVFYTLSLYYLRGGVKNKVELPILLVVFFMALFDFFFGNRALGIQILFLIYIFYGVRFYSLKRLFYGFLLILPVLTTLSFIRSGVFLSDVDLTSFFIDNFFKSRYLAADTGYYAYVNSLTFVAASEFISSNETFVAIKDLLVAIFFKSGFGPTAYDIASKYYYQVGGAFPSLFAYFYFGYFGSFLMAILISFYLRVGLYNRSNILSLMFVYFFITSSRWLLYSPIPLIRGMMLFLTVFAIVEIFRFLLRRKYHVR
jgi:hypothetical protein